jgi:transposase
MYPDCYGIDMSQLGRFIAFEAAVALLEDRGEGDLLAEVEERCLAQASVPPQRLVNHVRGSIKPFGERISGTTTKNFHKKAKDSIPEDLLKNEQPLLKLLEAVSTTIKQYDKQIEALCEEYSETKRLRQVKGVGPLTSLAFVLIIEDPKRFKKSRDVGSYLGLVPRRSQSGAQDPQLRITKAGDPFLRVLLVQSAHYILGPFGGDCDLRRHGEKIAARGGKNSKKRAVIAVARKLAVLLHRLWVTGKTYKPLREALAEPKAQTS